MMIRASGMLLIFTFFLGFFPACKPANSPENENKTTENQEIIAETSAKKTLCFQTEFPWKDEPETKDVTELFLEISGREVSGRYDWLPACKDQRTGILKGILSENFIEADYFFEQEGTADSLKIRIYLENGRAIVRETPFEETGADTILSVNCR